MTSSDRCPSRVPACGSRSGASELAAEPAGGGLGLTAQPWRLGSKHHLRRHRIAGQAEAGGDGQQLALARLRCAAGRWRTAAQQVESGVGVCSSCMPPWQQCIACLAWCHQGPLHTNHPAHCTHPAGREAMTRCSCAVMGMLARPCCGWRCAAAATTLQGGAARMAAVTSSTIACTALSPHQQL